MIKIYNSEVHGSTDDYFGDVEVSGNNEIEATIDDVCEA